VINVKHLQTTATNQNYIHEDYIQGRIYLPLSRNLKIKMYKVKLSLWLTEHHTMKAYSGVEV